MANLLDEASILLTPTAYNNGSMLAVKPENGDGDFTFSRNSAATRVNAQGLVEDVASNLPRIDYTDGCGNLKLEPQSTNLITYSEDFSQWNADGDTTIESGYLAPDGTNNAYKVSGTNDALILNSVSNLGINTTRSIYARTVSGSGTASLTSYFGNTNNIFTLTEQWQRFEVNNSISTGSTIFYGADFRGGTLNELILWGANATNDQDYATSYIPTTQGAISTRLADIANNSGNASLINSEEGVLYAEISAFEETNSFESISINNNSTSDRIFMGYYTDDLYITVVNGGQAKYDVSTPINVKQNNKIAVKYKAQDFCFYLNGFKINASVGINGGTTPIGLSKLSFDRGDGVEPYYGKVKALAVYKTALTDAQLTELTTI